MNIKNLIWGCIRKNMNVQIPKVHQLLTFSVKSHVKVLHFRKRECFLQWNTPLVWSKKEGKDQKKNHNPQENNDGCRFI